MLLAWSRHGPRHAGLVARVSSDKESQYPTCLAVQGGVELVDGGGDPQPGLEHHLLPLQPDVLGPPDEPAQVAAGLDVLADTEVLGPLLEQGVHDPLDLLPFHGERGGGNLLTLPLLSFFVDHLD